VWEAGSFKQAYNAQRNKALPAWHHIMACLSSLDHVPVNNLIKLYNVMVKPIALYASEIWGQELLGLNKRTIFRNWPSDTVNSMCIKVAKSILSVPRTASNAAVIAETGIIPLSYDIISGMLKYYRRLRGNQSNTMLNSAIIEDSYLVCKVSTTRFSWCHCVQAVLNQLNIAGGPLADIGADYIIPDCSKELKNSLQSVFEEYINNPNSKLRFYCKLKQSISTAPYLTSISNIKFRKAVTQLTQLTST
jgi:hypothetical protein